MYGRLIQRGVDFIFSYGDASEENRELYEYGLELVFMYLINAGALLLLGFFFGCFLETLLLLFGFALQQSFAGGYHAMTHLRCFLFMLAGWAGTMLILPIIESYRFLPCILAVSGLFFVFLFAPVKHVNFPMSKEKGCRMKKIARTIAVTLCVIVFVCSIFSPQKTMLSAIWGLTLFLSAVSIICAVMKEILHKKTFCQETKTK